MGQNTLSQMSADMMRFTSAICASLMKDDSARKMTAGLFLDKTCPQELTEVTG
jgi:hypothetical protein